MNTNRKIFFSIAGLLLAVLIIIYSSIFFTDFNRMYDKLSSDLRINVTSAKPDGIKVSYFPMPKIHIDQIDIPESYYFKDITLNFSLSSLLSFSPQISSIDIQEATIRLISDDTGLIYHDEFVSEIIAKDLLNIKTTIGKLILVESDDDIALEWRDFRLYEKGGAYFFNATSAGPNILEGAFKQEQENVIFNFDIDTTNYSLSLQESYKNGMLEFGNGKVTIVNSAAYIANFMPSGFDIRSYLNNSPNDIAIEFQLTSSPEAVNLSDIKFSGDEIKGVGSATISKSGQSSAELNFEYIDLSQNIDFNQNNKDVTYGYNQESNLYGDWVLSCGIDKLKIGENTISNVQLQADSQNEKVRLHQFSGQFDEENDFLITGQLTKNAFRNIFQGNIEFQHSDITPLLSMITTEEIKQEQALPFAFSSKFSITPVYLSLQDLDITLSDMHVKGNYSVKYIGNQPRVNANLNVDSLNLSASSQLDCINEMSDWVKSLFLDMKDSDYQNKFIPLRQIDFYGSYNIAIDNVMYNNAKYPNIAFNLEVAPGIMEVNRLYLSNEHSWVDCSISIAAQGVKPAISVTFYNGKILSSILSFEELLKERLKLLEHYDLSKVNLIISGYIDEIRDEKKQFGRIVFYTNNEDNLFKFEKLEFDSLGGRAQMTGSILLEPFTVNFSYGLASANLEMVSDFIPGNLIDTPGLVSASGILSTNGNSVEELLYNLYSKSSLIAKGVVWKNLSIDDFISRINNESYNIDNLQYDLDQMLLTGTTNISDMKLDFSISRGAFDFENINFKSKLTSSAGNMSFNLYEQTIEASLVSNFYILFKRKFKPGSYQPIASKLEISGDLKNLKKTFESEKIQEILNVRVSDEIM